MPKTMNQMILKQNSSDEFKSGYQRQQQQSTKPANNFQRFSATQKNPLFRNTKKQQESKKNKVAHNWSASNPKESFELMQPLKNAIVDEVGKQMKQDGKNTATRQAFNKVLYNNGLASGMFTTRDDRSNNGAPLSYRSNNKGQGQGSSNFWEQDFHTNKVPVLSPRGQASNKQSQKLVVHQGDNFFEEGEMTTTIVTPKDDLHGRQRVSLKEPQNRQKNRRVD